MSTVLAPAERLLLTTATRMDVLDVLRGVPIFGILVYDIGAPSGYEMVAVEARHLPAAFRAAAMTSAADHPRARRSRTPVSPSDLLSF